MREKTGKPLGGAAHEASRTISGIVEQLKGMHQYLFEDVDTSPLRGALDNVLNFFQGEGGAKLKGSLTRLFSSLFDTLFSGFSGEKGTARIEAMGAGLTHFLDELGKLSKEAGPVISKALDGIFQIVRDLGGGDEAAGFQRIADGAIVFAQALVGVAQMMAVPIEQARELVAVLRALGDGALARRCRGGCAIAPGAPPRSLPLARPITCADCTAVPRPCPFEACRYSLAGELAEQGRPTTPELSCALDIADDGPRTLAEVGDVLEVSRERVRQIETAALERLHRAIRRADLTGMRP